MINLKYFYVLIIKIARCYKTLIYIWFGSLILFYILYMRLRIRLPKALFVDLYAQGNHSTLIFYGILLTFFVILFIKSIKHFLEKVETANTKFYNVYKFMSKFNFIDNSLYVLDDFIKEKILTNYVGNWISKVGLFLYKHFQGNKVYFYIFFLVFPKILMLIAFGIDVFIFHKFFYSYKFSVFLLIPLLLKYIKYSLHKFWTENVPILDSILYFYDVTAKKRIYVRDFIFGRYGIKGYRDIMKNELLYGLTTEFVEENQHEPFDVEATLQNHLDNMELILIPVALFELNLEIRYNQILIPYVNVIIYGSYSIIWSYIIIYAF